MSGISKKVIPLLDRILVQRVKAVEKTSSGIFIPQKAQEELNEGNVIAVGPGALNREGKAIPVSVQPGDRVLLPPYGGSAVKIDSEDYLLFKDSEILAKLEN